MSRFLLKKPNLDDPVESLAPPAFGRGAVPIAMKPETTVSAICPNDDYNTIVVTIAVRPGRGTNDV